MSAAVRPLPAAIVARFSAQQRADYDLVTRALVKSRGGEKLTVDDKRVLRIVAKRAPLAIRDVLVAKVDQMLAAEGISPEFPK